jgi:hypothetical protein
MTQGYSKLIADPRIALTLAERFVLQARRQLAVSFRQACMNLSVRVERMHRFLLRLWTRTADATTLACGQPGGSPAAV